MPGVWKAAAYVRGAVVIFHSPKACVHIVNNMEINSLYRKIEFNKQIELNEAVPLISSQLKEKHSVFGGTDCLQKCIIFAIEKYKPQCVIIANSCVAGIIGDDVDAVGRKMHDKYNLPIITVECYGFLDGEYYQGYIETAKKLITHFFKVEKHSDNNVLLLGDNGGPNSDYAQEIKRMLQQMDIMISAQFPGYMTIAEMGEINAKASIIMSSRGQAQNGLEELADILYQRFAVKHLNNIYPIGWEKTKEWIAAVGQMFNCEEKAADLIQKEKDKLTDAATKFSCVTKDKKVVLFLGRLTAYFDPELTIEIIKRLQLHLKGIVIMNNYDSDERIKIKQLVKCCTDAVIYDIEYPDELLLGTDLILTTHELTDCKLKQIYLPIMDKAGTSGEIEFMRGIYRGLCSRLTKVGVIYV